MNVWRGLFRVWLVLSAIWVMYALVGSFLDLSVMYGDADFGAQLFMVPSKIVGPPMLVAAIALGIGWIARGFSDAVSIPSIPWEPVLNVGLIVIAFAGVAILIETLSIG